MKFQDNLRNLRLQRNYTQKQLADGLSTSQAAVAFWESGTREPDFATIQRIANFFQVPMSALLPSDDSVDADFIGSIAESLHQSPKLRTLFDRSQYLSDRDLDAVIGVINAISRERGDDT